MPKFTFSKSNLALSNNYNDVSQLDSLLTFSKSSDGRFYRFCRQNDDDDVDKMKPSFSYLYLQPFLECANKIGCSLYRLPIRGMNQWMFHILPV